MKLRILVPRDARLRATSEIRRYGYTLLALTRREIRKRYARTLLGSLWAVLLPLAMLGIYLTVFGFILRAGQTQAEAWDYALNMLAGLLPFQAFADGLHRACGALREDRSLLEREQFPGGVLPAARVLSASVAEIVGMVLLSLAAALYGRQVGLLILALPAVILLRILFTLGLAWMLSIFSVFVSDVAEVLGFVTTACLFLTPIVYSPASMPHALAWTLAINPLHHLVEMYRGIVLHGHVEPMLPLIVAMWAFMSAGLGAWIFRKSIERTKDFL
ncbi:O-antigen export system permease RfbD [Cupriavidus basilensis OR16]|uniref:Transport permease protein n=1 Tax=Cupriavidus basilensis OR16 TaxID=1127483 RepID=H1SG15_9BURK|nr:ABC transporter permease [Cupriavidus basilensis]EHP38501.1 O-antigen export system permease RfbD [Cupriavidus basilensis OR16]